MRRAILCTLCFFFILTAGFVHAADAPVDKAPGGSFVYRIEIADNVINPVAVEYIDTSIKKAEDNGAAALLIQLDTPGGLLSSTRKIVRRRHG